MAQLLARSLFASLAAVALLSAPAAAQLVGGDQYSLRRALGPESYTVETFDRPTQADTRPSATINPAAAQAVGAYRGAPASVDVPAQQPLTSKTQSALDYFGGRRALQQTFNQAPRRPRFISQNPAPAGAGGGGGESVKPFNHAMPDPTISPYHNLYREDLYDTLPNFFTLVRPQQRQMEQSRAQQRQLQQLQRQVRRGFRPTPAPGATPATGSSARFGDTGQYYGGWR